MANVSGEAVVAGRYSEVAGWANKHLRPYVLFPFLGLLTLFLAYPVFMVVYGSFKGGPPGTDAPFSVEGYVSAWTTSGTLKALMITFALAVPRVLTGVLFAIIVTWIITRTNTPLRGLFEQLMWLRVFLPALPMLVAWMLLSSGRTGLVNQFFMDIFHLSKPPLDIRTYWGIVFLTLMTSGSFFFMFMAPAFRNMDASLEESSRVSGAGNLTTLFRVTVPVMMPAILGVALLVFLFTIASYEMELFLLGGKGIYVFTTYIWFLMGRVPADHPQAMALSTVFMFVVVAVVIIQFKVLAGRQYVTVTGRGFGVRPIDLGRWKWVTFSLLMAWTLIGLVLPMVVMIMGTFQNAYGIWDNGTTFRWWQEAMGSPEVIRSIKNTLLVGFWSATVGTVLYSLMSYVYLRTKLSGRVAIEVLSWVPRMAPGIVMAVGMYWALLGGGIPGSKALYGSLSMMVVAVLIEGTPGAMRMVNGGMVQLSSELEEASRVSGGSWLRTMRRVVVPLLAPTLLNLWLLKFLQATRALVIFLFIYQTHSKVLSIDIFLYMLTNEMQKAIVLGVVLTAISMVVAIIARLVAMRTRRQMEVGMAA